MRTSSRLMPYEESAVGFAWMRTAGFWPPLMLTSPTPGNCEIFCASRVSAKSSTCARGKVFDVSARVRMGASAGLDLLYIGGGGRAGGGEVLGGLVAGWGSFFAPANV